MSRDELVCIDPPNQCYSYADFQISGGKAGTAEAEANAVFISQLFRDRERGRALLTWVHVTAPFDGRDLATVTAAEVRVMFSCDISLGVLYVLLLVGCCQHYEGSGRGCRDREIQPTGIFCRPHRKVYPQ